MPVLISFTSGGLPLEQEGRAWRRSSVLRNTKLSKSYVTRSATSDFQEQIMTVSGVKRKRCNTTQCWARGRDGLVHGICSDCCRARLRSTRTDFWVRPHVVTDAELDSCRTDLTIVNGRHPSVESGLLSSARTFTPTSTTMKPASHLHVITGPNQGGKSTLLRQTAIIAILAQAGSFVPADFAELGIVDKVFSRVGARDDLFRDRSTFMLEMVE